jgi:signal transduction histidine kinase
MQMSSHNFKPDMAFDPAIIAIFRLLCLLRTGVSSLSLLISSLILDLRPLRIQLVDPLAFLLIALYLASKPIQRGLGRWHLPIALFFATWVPILQRFILSVREQAPGVEVQDTLIRYLLETTTGVISAQPLPVETGWMPILFLPLVLIAWQYRFRYVILFSLVTFAAEIILQSTIAPQGGFVIQISVPLLGQTTTFLMIGFIVSRLARTLREQQDALREAYSRLSTFAVNAEALAISQERNRLARELHDTLAHALSATSIQLEASQALRKTHAEKADDLVARSLDNVRQGLNETRRALESLRASPLDDLGLVGTLRQKATEMAQQYGWKLTLEIPLAMEPLQPLIEQTLYRIADEALTNIGRHARAHAVHVQLNRGEQGLTLMVRDDGQGFDLKKVDAQKHFGLLGMRERAELAGGSLKVESARDQGTCVIFKLKVNS